MQNLTAGPKKPLPKHPCSPAPGSGPTGCPPHPHTLPNCHSITAAVSKQLPKELPLSTFLLTGHTGAEILPVSRNPAAAGSWPRPAVTVPCSRTAFVWDPEENNRSYFRLYGSGESPRPSAASKGTAASQGLAVPPGSLVGEGVSGDPLCPLRPLQGCGESQHDGTYTLGRVKDRAAWGCRAAMSR